MSDEKTATDGLSRGQFLKRGGAAVGGAVLSGGLGAATSWARPLHPSARDAAVGTIKIGFVSPLTGADAGFGEPDPYVISPREQGICEGPEDRGQDLQGPDHQQGCAVHSVGGGPGSADADQRRSGRPPALDLDA